MRLQKQAVAMHATIVDFRKLRNNGGRFLLNLVISGRVAGVIERERTRSLCYFRGMFPGVIT